MLNSLFRPKQKFITVRSADSKREIPDGLWTKCEKCGQILYNKELQKNLKVCGKCGYHFKISAIERLQILTDENTFCPIDAYETIENPLGFPGYLEKLEKVRTESGLSDGVVAGTALIDRYPVAIACMDFTFIGGSMATAEGEKITTLIELGIEKQLPVIIVATSGGARMHEGIFSLMQMAKTSAALQRLSEAGPLYISVLVNPVFGGVTASFGTLGDVIMAEPGALIGFAGARVIEQTREKLPEGFQTAEFLMEHGMIDMIVPRGEMKERISSLLKVHGYRQLPEISPLPENGEGDAKDDVPERSVGVDG